MLLLDNRSDVLDLTVGELGYIKLELSGALFGQNWVALLVELLLRVGVRQPSAAKCLWWVRIVGLERLSFLDLGHGGVYRLSQFMHLFLIFLIRGDILQRILIIIAALSQQRSRRLVMLQMLAKIARSLHHILLLVVTLVLLSFRTVEVFRWTWFFFLVVFELIVLVVSIVVCLVEKRGEGSAVLVLSMGQVVVSWLFIGGGCVLRLLTRVHLRFLLHEFGQHGLVGHIKATFCGWLMDLGKNCLDLLTFAVFGKLCQVDLDWFTD